MSVAYFYLAKAAQLDRHAGQAGDAHSRRALEMTAETWRLLARMAEEFGFDDLPAVRRRLPAPH